MTPSTNTLQKKESDSYTILVAEDDADILDIIQIVLSDSGYSVVTVCEGTEVKKQLKKTVPNLIFLDVWMPGMDGKEVAKFLKSNTKTKDIPVILISAHASLKELASEVGADNFLPKPFDIQDVVKLAEQYCPKG